MFNNTCNYVSPSPDSIMSLALGDKLVDGDLHKLRAVYEANLQAERCKLQEQCDKTTQLGAELGSWEEYSPAPNVDDVLAQSKATLPKKAFAITLARQMCEAFRMRHGLTRGPILPWLVLTLTYIGLMVTGETAITASFFYNANMVGSYTSAFLLSALIAFVNVLVSTVAGNWAGRRTQHGLHAADADNPEFKAIRQKGQWGFAAYFIVMIGFHITVGLIRSLESIEGVDHSFINYAELLTAPAAIFLMMSGACMSMLAYWKGKSALNDPYLDYGDHAKAVETTKDDFQDSYEESKEQVIERFDDAQNSAEDAAKIFKKSVKTYNKAVAECLEVKRNLDSKVNTAESNLRADIARIAGTYHIASDSEVRLSEAELKHLASLRKFSEIELPAFYLNTGESSNDTAFAEARSDALTRLSLIYQDALQATSGDQQ